MTNLDSAGELAVKLGKDGVPDPLDAARQLTQAEPDLLQQMQSRKPLSAPKQKPDETQKP